MLVTLEANAGLTALTEVFTQISSWLSSMVTTISSNPLLLLSLGIFATGAVIGLAVRLIRG